MRIIVFTILRLGHHALPRSNASKIQPGPERPTSSSLLTRIEQHGRTETFADTTNAAAGTMIWRPLNILACVLDNHKVCFCSIYCPRNKSIHDFQAARATLKGARICRMSADYMTPRYALSGQPSSFLWCGRMKRSNARFSFALRPDRHLILSYPRSCATRIPRSITGRTPTRFCGCSWFADHRLHSLPRTVQQRSKPNRLQPKSGRHPRQA